MPHPARLDTYTGYSLGCAGVWAAILALGNRRLKPPAQETLRTVCFSWWTGWASASIARVGYPPPRPLSEPGKERLARVSLVLVALGLGNVARGLIRGDFPNRRGY